MMLFHKCSSDDSASVLAPARRCRWGSFLLALVILLCGVAIGAGATVLLMIKHVQQVIHHPEIFPAHLASRLQSKLDLSDQQTAQVEGILRSRQAAIQKIRVRFQPEFKADLDGLEKDIAGVLNPEQAEEWRKWVQEKRRTGLPEMTKAGPAPQP